MLKLISSKLAMCVAAATLALAGTGVAQADLITNGSFESYTNGKDGLPSQVTNTTGQGSNYVNLTGWSLAPTGYTFLFAPGSADKTGSWTEQYSQYLKLWGTNDGGPDALINSPDGGNFVAQDPAYQPGALYQTVSGLTVGQGYDLSFYYAGAQQNDGSGGFTGDTTEGWQVSLGGQTLSTPILNNASHGFTGWYHETFHFTADSTAPVLSFLALGGPLGVPPFTLLDGVSMNASVAPVPPSALIAITGLVLVIGSSKLRNRKAARRTKLAL